MKKSKPATPSRLPWSWPAVAGTSTAIGTLAAGIAAVLNLPGLTGAKVTPRGGIAQFRAAKANDGFVVLRAKPTRSSAEVARVLNGEILECGSSQIDAEGLGHPWRPCRNSAGKKGFASDFYLEKV